MAADRFEIYIVDAADEDCRHVAYMLGRDGVPLRRFTDAAALIAYASGRGPACALLELQLPGASGLEAQEAIRKRLPHVPVIFVVRDGDLPSCVEAMRRGALDFLEKPVAPEVLRRAIALAEATSRARWQHELERTHAHERLARLTPRERQVLHLVIAGQRNKQIAHALASEESTVKVHRSRLMRKLEARSLAELVRLGLQLRLSPGASAGARPPHLPAEGISIRRGHAA